MPLIQTLQRREQADLCEVKASLVYRVDSRTTEDKQKAKANKQRKKKPLTDDIRSCPIGLSRQTE